MFEKLMNRWFKLHEGIRYLFVGCSNTGVGYILFVICYLLLQNILDKNIILFISYCISLINSFLCMKYLVFRSKGSFKKELPKYYTTYLILYLGNAGLLSLMVDSFHWNVLVSQFICTFFVAASGYLLNKFVSFRK